MLLAGAGLWLVIGICSFVALDIRGYLARPFVTDLKRRVETPYATYASISRLPTLEELGPNDGLDSKVLFLAGDGTAKLDALAARHLRLEANCLNSCTLLLKLVYYPFWQAHEVPSQPIPLRASTRAGLTELSLSPGVHQVDLELPVGRSEIWGAGLSFLSLVIVALLFVRDRLRNRAGMLAAGT
jgi:hypothetical protein